MAKQKTVVKSTDGSIETTLTLTHLHVSISAQFQTELKIGERVLPQQGLGDSVQFSFPITNDQDLADAIKKFASIAQSLPEITEKVSLPYK